MTERASIVARGEHSQLWFIRLGDTWVRAIEHPATHIETEVHSEQEQALLHKADCPSGTIWQRQLELRLPAGTRLRQRQSWPRQRQLSVMGYLKLGMARPSRRLREREFILTGNYRLTPVGSMQLGSEAAPETHTSTA